MGCTLKTNQLSRRTLIMGAAGTLGAAALYRRAVAAPAAPAWADWKDLLNMLPQAATLTAARAAAGLPTVSFAVQKIEEAKSTKTNFDRYTVSISKLPAGKTAQQLFNEMRKDLNNFFDHTKSTIAGYKTEDANKWASQGKATFGTIMLFKIPAFGPIGEQAAVITSVAEDVRWVFTPVEIGIACPGEHPVSGNREFGWKAVGNSYEFYTRAVDRATGICPGVVGEDFIFNGADTLWKSWQAKLVDHVNQGGGTAVAAVPVVHRPTWADVKASGLFTR